jgi:hypothetical protein
MSAATAATTTVVLRRARITVSGKDKELYSQLPDKREWLATHEIEMHMLDG